MASAVIAQLTQAFSFLREHPKLSCVLLLLLSPPLFRILLYFTPLLLSTALCIFALITLTPYVTATDAEVERQSMLGASSHHLKKKSTTTTATTTIRERKLEDVSGYGKPSLSSASSSSSSAASSAACPPNSAAEASWFSWMKGLNDIGRTWMENKLTEQGLALSDPANKETLLAFIEGSFADLITAQANPTAEIFAAIDNHEDVTHVAGLELPTERNDETIKASTIECVCEGYAVQKSTPDEEVVCAKVSSYGGGGELVENFRNEETGAAENLLATTISEVCAMRTEYSHGAYEVKSMQGNPEPLLDDVKARKQKLAHDSTLLVTDTADSEMPAATIMPRTPSRIPAPSKLLEASRRIFSKEEQSKALLSRIPLQASSAARVNHPFKSSFGSPHSKTAESSAAASVFKLPARKFLERSRSIPSKEGSKLSNTRVEAQAGNKSVQGVMKESKALCGSEVNEGVCDANEGVGGIFDVGSVNDSVTDVRISNVSTISSGAGGDDGPRFDEDLKVEEAQALVQSELKMLEVELDEVAAKLPKLDESFVYQKTPIKSTTTSLASTGTSIKCGTTLFSASPTFKTS